MHRRGTHIGRGVGRQRARDAERRTELGATERGGRQRARRERAVPGYTFPSEDKELEAVIPDTMCGAKAQKLSLKGKDVFNRDNEGPPGSRRC